MEKPKRTLLQRYGIPIHHLDFEYIANCNDDREVEKIVHILRSGEEGYYPDLMQRAEDKLRLLKPQSRLLRVEETVLSHDALSANEWQPIYDWNREIRQHDQELDDLRRASCANRSPNASGNENNNNSNEKILDLPPIRTRASIQSTAKQSNSNSKSVSNSQVSKPLKSTQKSIKTTDYRSWDRYNADEEILRMDLAEERAKEEVERQNRLNNKKSEERAKITEILPNAQNKSESVEEKRLQQLSNYERCKLAEDYRLCGNDYFRVKEYEQSIREYSRAIRVLPEGGIAVIAAYNNRAIAYIKLNRFQAAIDDCQNCLKLDPSNLKAQLRLAQATYKCGQRRESYALYQKVIELDSNNEIARKAMESIVKQFGEIPPAHSTRLKIEDSTSISLKPAVEKSPIVPAKKDYDFSELIKPNKTVNSKFAQAVSRTANEMKGIPLAAMPHKNLPASAPEIDILQNIQHSQRNQTNSNKILIEEIYD